jgi:hypothetical protein
MREVIDKPRYLPMVVALLVFIYVLIRAVLVDVTYDEAWTIAVFVPFDFIQVVTCDPCDANNHILNTVLIKSLFSFLPHTLFVARIPNLVGLILFLVFAFRLCKLLSPVVGNVTFMLLVLNPFVLDFFGIARGYGLSLGCGAGAVYFLCTYFLADRPSAAVYSLLWTAAAAYSSFSSLTLYLAVSGILLVFYLFRKERRFADPFIWLAVTACVGMIVWKPLRMLLGKGCLYYGGTEGFYQDTLFSLAKYSRYSMYGDGADTIILNAFIFIFVGAAVCSFISRKNAPVRNALLCLVLLCVAAIISQHYILGTLFVIDRAALFLYLPFILAIGFSVDVVSRKSVRFLYAVVVLPFIFNFIMNANFYKTVTWFFDAHTEQIFQVMNEQGEKAGQPVRFDFAWPLERSVEYYLKSGRYPHIVSTKQWRTGMNENFDYYIYLDKPLDRVGFEVAAQITHQMEKDTVLKFPAEGIYLFRKK